MEQGRHAPGAGALLAPHACRLAAGAACLLVLALTTSCYAFLSGPLLQLVLTGGEQGGGYLALLAPWFDAQQLVGRSPLLALAVAMVLLALVKGLAHLGQALALDGAAQHVGHRLRARLYRHLMALPLRAHRRRGLGDLITRLLDDVEQVQQAVVGVPVAVTREGLAVLGLLLVATWMSPTLTLVAAVALPAVAIVIGALSRAVTRAAAGRQSSLSALADRAARGLGGIREVKSCNAEAREVRALSRQSRRALGFALRRIAIRAISPLVNEVLAALALGGTLVYAGARVADGSIAPERFISFFTAVLLMYRPIKELGRAFHARASSRASAARVEQVLAEAVEPGSSDRGLPPLERALELRDVCYAYESTGPERREAALRGVSLTLRPGRMVAISGPSGAGKSTLANIVCGLEAPTSGELVWDGVSAAGRPLSALRSRVALVPQQPLLFDGTLADNLRLAAPDAGEAALQQVVERVGLGQLVSRLPRGLGTRLGTGAGGLSVGEIQRLSVGRALLREASVIVLDEPAAALDEDNERLLIRTLLRLRTRRALLVVAHGDALLASADEVLQLLHGRLRGA